MSSPKRQKKSSDENPVAIDAIISRIVGSQSLSFGERIALRKVNKQFKTLIDHYYSDPQILKSLSYNDLQILNRLYRVNRQLYLHVLLNEIEKTVDEFMGEGTGSISILTRKLRSGEFTLAVAERLHQRIDTYFYENMDTFMPPNQMGVTAQTQRDYNDIQKKLTLLDKYINKQTYSSKKTSSYQEEEFVF